MFTFPENVKERLSYKGNPIILGNRRVPIDQKGIEVSQDDQSFTFLLQSTPPPTTGRVNGAECLSGRSKKLSNAPKSFSTLSLRPNSKTLKVRFVTTEDAGIFECQVSTSPKLSLIFRLAVLGGRMMRKKCKSIFLRGNDDDDDENMASLSIISYPWESSFLTMCQYLDSAACWRPWWWGLWSWSCWGWWGWWWYYDDEDDYDHAEDDEDDDDEDGDIMMMMMIMILLRMMRRLWGWWSWSRRALWGWWGGGRWYHDYGEDDLSTFGEHFCFLSWWGRQQRITMLIII